jgi:hypothetical protein
VGGFYRISTRKKQQEFLHLRPVLFLFFYRKNLVKEKWNLNDFLRTSLFLTTKKVEKGLRFVILVFYLWVKSISAWDVRGEGVTLETFDDKYGIGKSTEKFFMKSDVHNCCSLCIGGLDRCTCHFIKVNSMASQSDFVSIFTNQKSSFVIKSDASCFQWDREWWWCWKGSTVQYLIMCWTWWWWFRTVFLRELIFYPINLWIFKENISILLRITIKN